MLTTRSGRVVKENSAYQKKQAERAEHRELYKRVKEILDKAEGTRDDGERKLLDDHPFIVRHVDALAKKHLTAQEHNSIYLDSESESEAKCAQLAELIRTAKSCVVYTGAGMSTAASIPDYRGPNGLWTMLAKGVKIACPDFARVKPTYSHMALSAMVKSGFVKHVVSQNCDGLHLRSSIDRLKLSELHGNCFVELCLECDIEYVRLFDVTEDSGFRKHATSRTCAKCGNQLRDSIIHFGEKLRNGPTYNWGRASESVKAADLIICIGSSLKVLKHYKCLWPKRSESVRICIVNIQWTPKDSQAHIKINSYCDNVFRRLISHLAIPVLDYSLESDPLFPICTPLGPNELNSTKKCILSQPTNNKSPQHQRHQSHDDSEKQLNHNSWLSQSFKNKRKNSIVKASKDNKTEQNNTKCD